MGSPTLSGAIAREDRARVAAVIKVLVSLYVGGAVAYTAVALAFPGDGLIEPLLTSAYCLGVGLAAFAARNRSPHLAGALVALGIWGIVGIVALDHGGLRAPVLVGYGLSVVVGGLLLGMRGTLVFTALSVASVTALLLADGWDVLPHRSVIRPSTLAVWAGHVAFLALTGVAVALGARGFVGALGRALRDELEMRLLNEQLETSRMLLTQRVARLEVLTALGQQALAGVDVPALRITCVNTARDVLGTDFATLRELERSDIELEATASAGWGDVVLEPELLVSVGQQQAGYTLRQGRPVMVEDMARETRFTWSAQHAEQRIRSGISVVVEGRGGPRGVLSVYARLPHRFDDEDVQFLQAVANVLGSALVNRGAESSLAASERRYAELVEASPDGIMVLDDVGRIELANPAICRMTGRPLGELVGRPFWETDIFPETSLERAVAAFKRLLDGAPGRQLELDALRADTTTVPVEINARRVGMAGERLGVQVMVRDITARRAAEKARARLEEELRQAQRLDSLGRLAAGVAHDFNNLLTVILANAEMLRSDHEFEDQAGRALDAIKHSGKRAANLTRQLLAFGRKQVLDNEVLDLNEVVWSVDPMLRQLMGPQVEVKFELERTPMRVRADSTQLEQVIINLAINARDAMPTGGTFRCTTEFVRVRREDADADEHRGVPPGPYIVLQVEDGGHGMDDETRARVFDPFFTTKAVGRGTGLGLATVHGIVAQSGGFVICDSAVGEGTRFRVYLPQEKGEAPKSYRTATPIPWEEFKGPLLLTEDNDDVRRSARAILERAGLEVIEARDGVEALASFEELGDRIKLLVTDVVMPGMSGAVLAQELRARRPDLKVLYVSGFAGDVVDRHGIMVDGRTFLPKPFTPEQLVGAVRTVLRDG